MIATSISPPTLSKSFETFLFKEVAWINDSAILPKLRHENGHEEKRKDSDRKGFKRVKNGYICPIGRFMRHLETIEINHRKPHLMMIF